MVINRIHRCVPRIKNNKAATESWYTAFGENPRN